MSEGKRPGGLTALAVINFVLGGFGVLFLMGLFMLLSAADSISEGESTELISQAPNAGLVWISILFSIVAIVLLITSGVGYLGQKKVMGRFMGNGYAIASLASTAIGLAVAPFGIGTIIGLIYPILTLALINTTFKDDLVN